MTEEQRIEEILNKLLKPSDYPWVLVSNDNIYWEERILERVVDGRYRCVCNSDVEAFENGQDFSMYDWPYMKPIPEVSSEPWDDRLKIMNWCHKQKELILVSYNSNFRAWNSFNFNDYTNKEYYKWNKLDEETNELIFPEGKTFCDRDCL